MILSISFQAKLFLLSILIGGIIGLFYDFIRIFRSLLKHNIIFIQIEDILYWILMGIVVFLIFLNKNNGEIRGFLILGILLGMLFYFLYISNSFLKFFKIILRILKRIVLLIYKIILTPINIIIKIISVPFKIIYYSILKFFKSLLKKNKFCVKLYNKAKNIKGWRIRKIHNDEK